MLAVLTGLRLADIDALTTTDREGYRQNLDRLLDPAWPSNCDSLSDGITHKYLVHAGPSRQLTEIRPLAFFVPSPFAPRP